MINGYSARKLVDEVRRQLSKHYDEGTKVNIQIPGIGLNRCE